MRSMRMRKHKTPKHGTRNAQIVDEAADWFVAFSSDEPGAADRQDFDRWLRTSPEHVRAYLEITALWEDAKLLAGGRPARADELLRAARDEQKIVRLADREPVVEDLPAKTRRRWAVAGLATAATVVCAVAGVVTWTNHAGVHYETEIGEQRTINLTDGSSIELDAHSRIRVRLGDTQRRVDLLQGQALFRVAKDASRPFIVYTDSTSVHAVGTRFDVYRKDDRTVVTVVEGRVAVTEGAGLQSAHGLVSTIAQLISAGEPSAGAAASADARVVYLTAGEQITVAQHAAPGPSAANVAATTAWTQRKLVFNSAPLAEVISEYNRYNTRRLIIRDTSLETFHVSGVFSASDGASLVEFLRAQPGVAVQESASEIVITAAAERH